MTIDGLEVGRYQHGTHGETVGYALGHRDDVGLDAQPLVGEELTATAIAALYLVAYQRGAIALAGVGQILGKLRRGHLDAADALYALQDDGTYIALLEFGLPGGQVVEWQVGDMAVIVDGCDNLRIVGNLDSQRGAAVEGFPGRQHARAAIAKRCQLQRILVGLGTAVDEEQLIVIVAAHLAKALGQLLLKLVNNRVGVEPDLLQLFSHFPDVVGVRVADGDDGMTAVQV